MYQSNSLASLKKLLYSTRETLQYAVLTWFQPDRFPTTIIDLKPLANERGWQYQVHQDDTIQQRSPSKTIGEEILDIVRKGRKRVRNKVRPAYLAWLRSKQRHEEMYYSHLGAVTRYPISETFTCEVPNATVINSSGAVLTDQFELLGQSLFRGSTTAATQLRMRKAFDSRKQIKGRYLSLLDRWGSGYAHWLLDILPKLDLVDLSDDQLKIIVPATLRKYQIESLQLLGISENRLYKVNSPSITVESLVICHAAQNTGVPSAVHLLNIRDELVKAAMNGTPPIVPTRRLYISRARSRRPIVNENQLHPLLKNYGFEVIFAEDLSFSDQIRLCTEAKCILGAHGAGMHNALFCQPGAIVIEIFNRRRWDHTACRVASLAGHQHWHLFGEDVGQDWATLVDIAKLEKVLSYALGANFTIYDEPY